MKVVNVIKPELEGICVERVAMTIEDLAQKRIDGKIQIGFAERAGLKCERRFLLTRLDAKTTTESDRWTLFTPCATLGGHERVSLVSLLKDVSEYGLLYVFDSGNKGELLVWLGMTESSMLF